MQLFLSALSDSLIDSAKLIPFLYITYLLMEILERKTSEKTTEKLARVGRLGPAFGAVFGIVPQCGFSAAAASLYAGGVISIGTLIAVFLSTSDEMLPILISERVSVSAILSILGTKVLLGLVTGFGIDFILRFTKYKSKTEKRIHDLCEAAHCGCDEEEGSVFLAALKHTVQIVLFIFLITLGLTLLIDVAGSDRIGQFLNTLPVLGVLLAALIGLIPNCASSVMLTQLYLSGLLGAGQMMAGLLVSAGVGLLVLFRTNRHYRENIKITILLYACGVFWGLLIEGLRITF